MTSIDNLPIVGPAVSNVQDDDARLVLSGRLIRIARPRSETFDPLEDPEAVLGRLRKNGLRADLFSFAQRLSQPEPRYTYYRQMEPVAILEIGTYEQWWKATINDKTRNMVRKAGKKGVTVEITNYTDDLVRGIKHIYDECPIRQGKRSRHYGKSFETIKREHGTFLDRSEFIAAHLGDRLIGFAKLIFQKDFASVMNLIALIAERDKAPTNALMAKAVERCATRGVDLLHYGVWSRRGFGDFKMHHGFTCRHIPRYYVPLTRMGAVALQLGLHRSLAARLPDSWLDRFANLRMKWYSWRYPMK